MEVTAEPKPTAPLLAVQHAARMLRIGGLVRIENGSEVGYAIAAEAAMSECDHAFLASMPHGGTLVLTGQRLAALGLPIDPRAIYELPLARAPRTPGLIAMLADPTAPVDDAAIRLEGIERSSRPTALAVIELCKLAGLLPAAILAPEGIDLPVNIDSTGVPLEAITGYRRLSASTLRPVSEARVPLADAENARIVSFRPADGGPEQYAILVGEPEREAAPLTRLHSECFTGDFLGSLRCDCGDQLRGAIRRMAHEGAGVLLYLAQEGRGIGLANKLRAYMLQDSGLDTVDANHHLGFENDERDFWAAAAMLRQLGIGRVRLLTNNPAKIAQLQQYGIEIAGRVPHIFEANAHNRGYLLTKALKSGHMLAVDELQQPKKSPNGARLSVV
ncbi:GTP cyclohydrolase II [Benzoatithermus flavus]|uniref:GTP cyclohydrolase-2 n=1 Tax=Benzoatithermus flavus TaxID=3108223 RepID=A0ABU8XVI6_9PROT